MKKLLHSGIACLLFSLSSLAQQQVTQEWVQRFNGPDSLFDVGTAIDVFGSVYVTGRTITTSGERIVVLKYSANGTQEWASFTTGHQPVGIVLDQSRNAYITGISSTGTFLTLKYDSSGTLQWADSAINTSIPTSIALDLNNNVYVTGSDSSGNRIATLKYNTNGVFQWSAIFQNNLNGSARGNDIAIDENGNIYVTGLSYNGTSFDYTTLKYNSNGIQQWVSFYNAPANSDDFANAISLDAIGNIYITGFSTGIGTGYDYATIQYDANGVQQWVTRYNGTGNGTDIARDIAADGFGNINITGNSSESGTQDDFTTIQYSNLGIQKWIQHYNGTANSTDQSNALALDYIGNIYITGFSTNSGTGQDYTTLKYDINGNQQWIQTYNGTANSTDQSNALVTDVFGNVYVTGLSLGVATNFDIATIKYSQPGFACPSAIDLGNNDTCANATITNTPSYWFSFIPDSSNIEISVISHVASSGYIQDVALNEGLCNLFLSPIASNTLSSPQDSIIKLEIPDLIVGIPYFVQVFREQPAIFPNANFDICIKNLAPPIVTDTNGIVFLNGIPSHVKDEVILRISSIYLKMNAVDDKNKQDAPLPVFVQPQMIQRMANQIFHGDVIGLGQLHVKKVFPNMASIDSISISRLGDAIRIPNFWETFILTIPDTMSVFKTSRLLNRTSGIRYSEPNYVGTYDNVPNDAFYASNQGSLHPTIAFPNGNINVEGAWDIETGKPFVKIGLDDTGIDQTHDELKSGKVGGGKDYTTGTGLAPPYDNLGHGTACAGIIGGYRNNTTGIAGIAGGDAAISNTGCTLYDMRIGALTLSKAVNAITDGATSISAGGFGLHILSNSFGFSTTGTGITLHDAVQFAVQNGVVVVASRGNAGNTNPNFPASYQDEMVLSVGASGTNGEYKDLSNGSPAFSSSYGGGVDFIAPGCDELVYTTQNNTNGYTVFNGTSASAPHVSGVAGLMLSHVDQPFPTSTNLTVEDVENILQMSAVDKNTSGYDDKTGWGLIDAAAAMNKIKKPAYKIQHFGVGQNVVSSSVSPALQASNIPVQLLTTYQSLAPGTYLADRYIVTVTLNYNLSSPNDQIITSWPRFSSTLGWNVATNPFNRDNWCQIISVTNTQAILRTYIYNVKSTLDGHAIIDPWLPTQFNATAALSIYTFDPTLSGVNEINSNGSLISAFPNPANNSSTISVSLTHPQEISLELYDTQGKLVKNIGKGKVSGGKHQYEVSLTDISEGIYFYRLVTENASCGKKLIVIK